MNKFVFLIIGFVVLLNITYSCKQQEIKILLTTGGHEFQEEPFIQLFDNLTGINYTHVKLPESAELLKPGLEQSYDVMVMYDMVDSIGKNQQKAFVELLKKGIGIVALHHNLGAHKNWDEYSNIIGGKYLFETEVIAGKEYKESTYAHDQDININIVDTSHPITKGMSNFQIHDETYKGYYVSSDVKVLLTTDHQKSDPEMAWIKYYENSPVCYILLGHDAKAWENPVYSKILQNAIRWAASETKK
jgi:type 1 glutamine amidotransferase